MACLRYNWEGNLLNLKLMKAGGKILLLLLLLL
jgi:hypothetical protein